MSYFFTLIAREGLDGILTANIPIIVIDEIDVQTVIEEEHQLVSITVLDEEYIPITIEETEDKCQLVSITVLDEDNIPVTITDEEIVFITVIDEIEVQTMIIEEDYQLMPITILDEEHILVTVVDEEIIPIAVVDTLELEITIS